jgi:hypothetical protein
MNHRRSIESLTPLDRSELSGLFFSEEHESVPYHEAVIEDIVMDRQPFDYDPLSPTPLDPFHLRTAGPNYYHAARMLMEERLDSVVDAHNIPDGIKSLVMHEIEVEHEHRSHKNNAAMRELREYIPKDELLERKYANDIIAARAGVSNIGRLALLLANAPTMGGIEVMKFTQPFDQRAMTLAEATFVSRLRMTEMQSEGEFTIVDGKIGVDSPEILDTSKNVGPHVIAYKGKEADIVIGGRHLELVTRQSYIALGESLLNIVGIQPVHIPVGDKMINVQPIAVTKYLRVPKS